MMIVHSKYTPLDNEMIARMSHLFKEMNVEKFEVIAMYQTACTLLYDFEREELIACWFPIFRDIDLCSDVKHYRPMR